jgi:hypothetical protein
MELTQEYFDEQLKRLATKADFDNLKTFIQTNVALKDDIQTLKTELPSKEDFSQLQTSVDGLAKLTKDYYEEVIVLRGKVERMEKWIQDASLKLGLKYEV